MTHSNVLLLNLCPSNCLGDELGKILASGFAGHQVKHESLERVAQEDFIARLTHLAASFAPALIALILDSEDLPQAQNYLRAVGACFLQATTIIVAEAIEPGEVMELLQLGACDFLVPPLTATNTLPRLWRLLEKGRWRESLTQTLKEKIGLKRLIGESETFLAATGKIPLAARCDAGVFISGETGTGKEMCARAIHYLSARMRGPFVPVNCGAIPTELVENELFGHERGAFTGALTARHGMIHEAEGGTLFLDEIDCLPLLAQTKLLRFLQEKEYRPLGSTKARSTDARFLAASNLDPAEALRQGKLRRDLYYRLNVIPIALPPLRERYEDIPLLARHFLAQYAMQVDKPVTDISPAALHKLVFYDWPGNIRELEHTIELAVMLAASDQLSEADISLPDATSAITDEPFQKAKAKIVAEFEKSYIQKLLLLHRGNISRAAEAAHKNRRAFFQLIRKHRIDANLFRFSAV